MHHMIFHHTSFCLAALFAAVYLVRSLRGGRQ